MPRCKSCGKLIHSGQHCKVCQREPIRSVEEPEGPNYVECDYCDGRSWIRDEDDKKVDCPVCGGFGKVRIDDRQLATDGGQHEDIIVADDGGEIIDYLDYNRSWHWSVDRHDWRDCVFMV